MIKFFSETQIIVKSMICPCGRLVFEHLENLGEWREVLSSNVRVKLLKQYKIRLFIFASREFLYFYEKKYDLR